MASEKASNFDSQKVNYFGHFAIRYRTEMRRLIEGRILGKESQGWRNVAEHNLLAGVVANKIGQLVGLPEDEQATLVSVAATHDWDKRLEKEKTEVEREISVFGNVQIGYDVDKFIAEEQNKEGLVRVTGNDWRDFESWSLSEKVLRYVDSSLVPQGAHADFADWHIRIDDLRSRHSEIDTKLGMEMYGMPLFDKLAQITGEIEVELYGLATAKDSRIRDRYSSPNQFSDLVKDSILQDISSVRT